MKKIFSMIIIISLIAFVGCATLGIFPKTKEDFKYLCSINPDDIEAGKYNLVNAISVNPWVIIAFYYQKEKDRIVGTVFVYNDSIKELTLFRIFYAEKEKMYLFEKCEEKKEWVIIKSNNFDNEAEIVMNMKRLLEEYKRIEKL